MAGVDYRQKAIEMYDPSYNIKRQGVIDQTNKTVTNYENQKGGVNLNYDGQVANQTLQNNLGKNNFSNTMLGRGMGRSTIVGTGLAGLDQAGARKIGAINSARTNDLNNIESMKAQANNSMEATLNSLLADRETGISNTAQQLQQYDEEKAFKERQQTQAELQAKIQAEAQAQQFAQEMAYKQRALDLDTQYKNASLMKSTAKATKPTPEKPGSFYQTYMDIRNSDPSKAQKFLEQNAGDIIDRYGDDYYRQVAKEQSDYMDNYNAQQKKAQKTTSSNTSGVSLGQHLLNLIRPGDNKWW